MSMARKYEESHGFLDFNTVKLKDHPECYLLLGQAYELVKQIGSAPLPPVVAKEIAQMYLVKGVQATNAIEGNPLTEIEVAAVLRGESKSGKSLEYRDEEQINVAKLVERIEEKVYDGTLENLSIELIKEYNKLIIEGTEHESYAVPGYLRTHEVGVGNYKAVPPEDVEFLMGKLVNWIDSIVSSNTRSDEGKFANYVLGALYAHLYFAWIHPFGDGNGRTARIVEGHILISSTLAPFPVFHLLSDHYNRTRNRYQELFDQTRKSKNLYPFILYALEGFLDGLRKQMETINNSIFSVAWVSFSNDIVRANTSGKVAERLIRLVLALSSVDGAFSKQEILEELNDVSPIYQNLSGKTLSRDLAALADMKLIKVVGGDHYKANLEIMRGFYPKKFIPQESLKK